MAQIDVKVIDKVSREESTITYKAFLDVSYRFELLGQVDQNGNLISGDPNLQAQHRRKSVNVTAAKVGVAEPQFSSANLPESLRKHFDDKVAAQGPTPEQVLNGKEKLLNQFPQDNAIVKMNQEMIQDERKELAEQSEQQEKPKRKYTKRIKETV